MSKLAFERIQAGLRDAIAHAQGAKGRARTTMVRRREVDVAALRARLGLTQRELAQLCGVSTATLRNWEQGRRRPRGPSRALLHIVEREPEAALRAMSTFAA